MAPLIGFASFPSIPWKCASVWNATHRQITNISLRSFSKHMIRQVQVFGGGWNSYMSIVFYLCTYTYVSICGTHAWIGAWFDYAMRYVAVCIAGFPLQCCPMPQHVQRGREGYHVVEYMWLHIYGAHWIICTHTHICGLLRIVLILRCTSSIIVMHCLSKKNGKTEQKKEKAKFTTIWKYTRELNHVTTMPTNKDFFSFLPLKKKTMR